ncbi:MAG: AI-2E family transporter [Armatimonadota bacterium]
MPVNRLKDSHSWMPLIILFAIFVALYMLWNIVYIFILAAFFAFLVYPIVKLLDRRLPHIVSILIIYFIITVIIFIIAFSIAPVIAQQFRDLVDNFPNYVNQARTLIDSAQSRYVELPDRWKTVADNILNELQGAVISVTSQTFPAVIKFFTGLATLVFIPLLAFFMLLKTDGYKHMIIAITPKRSRDTANNLISCMGQSLWAFIKGELLLMTVVGFAVGIGLSIVGMPYAAVFGLIAALLELIPTFGPIITTVIVVLFGLVIDPVLALKGMAVTTIVQLLENIFLVPLVMGKSVGLDPITVAFSIFLGGSLAGPLGALIAIPFAMILKIAILYFYVDDADLPGKELTCIVDTPPKEKPKDKRKPSD